MTRIGEHDSYISDKESGSLSSDCEEQTKSRDEVNRKQKIAEQEFDQLAKRSYMVRRGRNNRLLVRPILEMIFDEGPNSYELNYGLPGHNFFENKTYSDRRIHGVGINYYQRCFQKDIIKKSKKGVESGFFQPSEIENTEKNLYRYYMNK